MASTPRRLRVGDRLRLGSDVLLEVEQLGKPAGIAHIFNYRSHALLPSDGVFFRVVIGGTVAPGDEIEVMAPG